MDCDHVIGDLKGLIGDDLEVEEVDLANEDWFDKIVEVVVEDAVVFEVNQEQSIRLAVIVSPYLHCEIVHEFLNVVHNCEGLGISFRAISALIFTPVVDGEKLEFSDLIEHVRFREDNVRRDRFG